MLSRLAINAACPRLVFVRAASTSQSNNAAVAAAAGQEAKQAAIFENEKAPERDLVNFPRRKRPIYPDPVRHLCVPEEWFKIFHEKTGVTGPYMFGAALTTFLMSKEIWVIEHDFFCGIALFGVLATIYKTAGPGLDEYLTKEVDQEEAALKSIRQTEVDRCKDAIKAEETSQWMATSYETLIDAKRESVALQLEAEYRNRLQEAYKQVKRRLDYQLETSNVFRRTEQKHMVNWIVSNVRKNITAKQEEDALKKCISDLKSMNV